MDSAVKSFRQLAIHIHKQEAEGEESLYSAKSQHLIYSGTHWMVVFIVTVFLSTSVNPLINLFLAPIVLTVLTMWYKDSFNNHTLSISLFETFLWNSLLLLWLLLILSFYT